MDGEHLRSIGAVSKRIYSRILFAFCATDAREPVLKACLFCQSCHFCTFCHSILFTVSFFASHSGTASVALSAVFDFHIHSQAQILPKVFQSLPGLASEKGSILRVGIHVHCKTIIVGRKKEEGARKRNRKETVRQKKHEIYEAIGPGQDRPLRQRDCI